MGLISYFLEAGALGQTFLLAKKSVLAWPVGLVTNFAWMAYGWETRQQGFFAAGFVWMVLEIYGWYRWHCDKR